MAKRQRIPSQDGISLQVVKKTAKNGSNTYKSICLMMKTSWLVWADNRENSLKLALDCQKIFFNPVAMANKFGQLIDASVRPHFSTWFEDRRTDQQTYLPTGMQFYVSVMSLGLPDEIHEEKTFIFCNLKKNALRTDGWMDGRTTDGPTDGQTLL